MTADQIIAKYKLDPDLFPPGVRQHLHCSLNANGAIVLDEIGLLLPADDLSLIYTCVEIFSPRILVAPNNALFAMKDAEQEESLPFTHLIPWYENNVWLVLFMAPTER